MEHCIAKIRQIVHEGRDDRRSIFQLGYNLGRLGELTGLGRGPFWDAWKGSVEAWDLIKLEDLALGLRQYLEPPLPIRSDSDDTPFA